MTPSAPDPDEAGTPSFRERAILADIATGLAADTELVERIACDGRRPGIVRVRAGPVALLVVALTALAG